MSYKEREALLLLNIGLKAMRPSGKVQLCISPANILSLKKSGRSAKNMPSANFFID